MADTLDQDLSAIKAALEAGPTKGEWRSDGLPVPTIGTERYAIVESVTADPTWADEQERADAAWIAAAHPDRISRLVAELERLRGERKFAGWFYELPSAMSHRLWEQGGHEQRGDGDVALYE